jgi:lipoic acid synthetase
MSATLPDATARARKPDWLKVRAPGGENYQTIKGLLRELKLHTVCEEAACPNVGECWAGGTATLMLMGDTCTRGCKFCHVKTGNPRGALDHDEPRKVAEALAKLRLTYVVLTSVDRDDLADGGADHIGRTVEAIKEQSPATLVEVLVPDFRGDPSAVERVVRSGCDVYAHNVETIARLTRRVRDGRCDYRVSLGTLRYAKQLKPSLFTKSSVMLGLGETVAEVEQTMDDLREVGCDILTLGQYLRPSDWHLPVETFVPPETFRQLEATGLAKGFLTVPSGPLVRSSYRAGEKFLEGLLRQRAAARGAVSTAAARATGSVPSLEA